MRKGSWLSRVLMLAVIGALVAGAVLGFNYLRGRIVQPDETPAAPVSGRDDADDTLEVMTNGSFQLRVFDRLISGSSYISFSVYRLSDGEELFTCGRLFPADEVVSVAWVSGTCDIEVRMKDGKTVTFSYDGITEWI
ncbi:MAG: hypothetical protein IJS53_00775 [Clostridia bacterium]|nr:hypothetical protein [Clostridia bacterium]